MKFNKYVTALILAALIYIIPNVAQSVDFPGLPESAQLVNVAVGNCDEDIMIVQVYVLNNITWTQFYDASERLLLVIVWHNDKFKEAAVLTLAGIKHYQTMKQLAVDYDGLCDVLEASKTLTL